MRCLPCLRGEALLKSSGRVVPGHDEQVVKCRDYFPGGPRIHALIERMKETCSECQEARKQQAPPDIGRGCTRRMAQLFRAIAMQELIAGMQAGKSV